MTEQELTFYRRLFLKRYALLVKRTEELYKLSPERVQQLQEKVLTIDWIDGAIERLPSTSSKVTSAESE